MFTAKPRWKKQKTVNNCILIHHSNWMFSVTIHIDWFIRRRRIDVLIKSPEIMFVCQVVRSFEMIQNILCMFSFFSLFVYLLYRNYELAKAKNANDFPETICNFNVCKKQKWLIRMNFMCISIQSKFLLFFIIQ